MGALAQAAENRKARLIGIDPAEIALPRALADDAADLRLDVAEALPEDLATLHAPFGAAIFNRVQGRSDLLDSFQHERDEPPQLSIARDRFLSDRLQFHAQIVQRPFQGRDE